MIRDGLSVPWPTWAAAQLGRGSGWRRGGASVTVVGDAASLRKRHTRDPAAVITQKPYL